MIVAKRGGNILKIVRETYEKESGNSAITSDNVIGERRRSDKNYLENK